MKFAHRFEASLKKEKYPQEWLDSAISYRQLKKCIRKVQQELQALGLDPQVLEHVVSEWNDNSASRPYRYCVSSIAMCLLLRSV